MEHAVAESGADDRGLGDPAEEGRGGALRFLVGVIVLVGLMFLLLGAVHPSGLEGCGGG